MITNDCQYLNILILEIVSTAINEYSKILKTNFNIFVKGLNPNNSAKDNTIGMYIIKRSLQKATFIFL